MQKVEHGVKEAKALGKRQPFTQKRIIQSENLNHASGPTNALTDVSG